MSVKQDHEDEIRRLNDGIDYVFYRMKQLENDLASERSKNDANEFYIRQLES